MTARPVMSERRLLTPSSGKATSDTRSRRAAGEVLVCEGVEGWLEADFVVPDTPVA
ncbi:MAG: hypothetical protein IT380_06765 [Myxococcales bacterium]|nr:hypothetical protein [Myxococcales bacterium]